jgi:hypothetical protein
MQAPTATVSIAPFPVPMQVDETLTIEPVPEPVVVEPSPETNAAVHLYKSRPKHEWNAALDKMEAMWLLEDPVQKAEEPRVMATSEVAQLIEAVTVKIEPPVPTPPPSPAKKAFPSILKRQKSFIDLTNELPSCCPMMSTTMPLQPPQQIILAFFAGALIGCGLVMCFSDSGVVTTE